MSQHQPQNICFEKAQWYNISQYMQYNTESWRKLANKQFK